MTPREVEMFTELECRVLGQVIAALRLATAALPEAPLRRSIKQTADAYDLALRGGQPESPRLRSLD